MPKQIMITKGDGQIVPFDERKVRNSIARTGIDKKTIDQIVSAVKKTIKPRMKTSDVYRIVSKELEARKPWAAARYNLRAAIVKMGPAGFHFEKYVASILTAYGYKTSTPDIYQGACIKHEIDVDAQKDGRRVFIEAKFRHDFHGSINIKDTMATWSRFLDLVDGSNLDLCPHFDEVWIVTNARFTDQSLKFGHCKNMKLVGWNHPEEKTFAQMVDLDALYPVTIMPSLTNTEMEAFAKANLMLCRDVNNMDIDKLKIVTGLTKKRLAVITQECDRVVSGDKA